jgi:hypothetical protein
MGPHGVSGYDRVIGEPANSASSSVAYAWCPYGTQAVGGGFFAAGEALILWSRPYLSSAGDGWSVGFLPRAGDVNVYSYAVCVIAA